MAQETVITAKVDTFNASKSINQLTNDVKQYRNDLRNLQIGTEEYQRAQEKLVSAQSRLNEVNKQLQTSTRGLTGSFSAVTGSLNTIVGGFTAVQGIIGITSDNTERFQSTLIKLQSALALTQGITAFTNGINAARIAFRALNTTILANPLVALGVALVAVTTALIAFTSRKREDIKVTEEQTATEVSYINTLKEEEVQLKRNNDLLAASGKTKDQIIQSDIAFYRERIKDLERYWQETRFTNSKEQNQLISDTIQNYYNRIEELEHSSQVERTRIATSESEKRRKEAQAAAEKELAEKKAEQARIEMLEEQLRTTLEETNLLYEQRSVALDNARARESDLSSAVQFEIEENNRLQESLRSLIHDPEASIEARIEATDRLTAAIQEGFALQDEAESIRLQALREAAEEEILIGELTLKRQKQIEKAKQDARLATLSIAESTLSSFSSILGEETAAGKSAAVAAATINTYQSATAAYSALAGIPIVGPGLATAAAASAIIAGIANVKEILSVKVPGTSADTTSTTGITLPSMPEVNVPMVETHNNLDANDYEFYNRDTRAYVVESDISSTQKRIAVAENESTF